MKLLVFLVAMIMVGGNITAQPKKITWTYSAKKIGNNKYEIHIVATPPQGWHIYSQLTPEGGPIPTTFRFNKNALVNLQGKLNKKGKVITYYDENFKVDVKYFEGRADFVQVVTLKGNIKTNISGEVESMICNDRTCMPPATQKFDIALN